MNFPKNFDELKIAMQNGFQSSGVSYWQHGEQVAERFNDLLGDRKLEWCLPKWFNEYNELIEESLLPMRNSLNIYHIWHDCGKPYCKVTDEYDKNHYPDHANVSADIWESLGGGKEISNLIRRDMEAHLLRPSDALEFSKTENALALLITAICETHANAVSFAKENESPYSSESFKIKMKRLSKAGIIVVENLTKT